MAQPSASMTSGWVRLVLAPLVVALLVISVQAFRKPLKAPYLDEFYYLSIARDLALHGVFTDGTFKRGPFGTGEGPEHFRDEDARWAKPGRFFAPVYPMLAYVVGRFDGRVAAAIRCHVGKADKPGAASCPNSFGSLVAVGVVLWALAMLAVFAIAHRLSGSEAVAWLALIIALATGEAGYYARTYLSETATVPAFLAFMLFALWAVESGRVLHYALAGLALGIAALSRPAYAYLIYLLAPALMLLALTLRSRFPALPSSSAALAFAVASMAALMPWMLRNQIQFGDPTLSRGYAEVILMQRVSYNQMSLAEWFVAWIYWLPDFGDEVAKKLFDKRYYELLGWTNPDCYYLSGGFGTFRQRVLAEAGDERNVLPLLYRRYLIGDLAKHVLVTLPLTMRGLGVAKYLSVAGVLLAWPVARHLAMQGKLSLFLAVSAPPLVMAGLHGFVSVNIERYNLPTIAVYAAIVAIAIGMAVERHRGRPL